MKNSNTGYIAGIILIIFGGVWLTSNIGIFDFDIWEFFWPSVFITIGIVLALKGRAIFLAVIFIFFGTLNLASNIFYVSFDYMFENFWPIILIALGLLILFKKRGRELRQKNKENGGWEDYGRKERKSRHRRDDREFGNPFYYNGTEKEEDKAPETKTGTGNTGEKTDTGTETGEAKTAETTGAKPEENTNSQTPDEPDKNKENAAGNDSNFKSYSSADNNYYSDYKNYYSGKKHSYYSGMPGYNFESCNPSEQDTLDEVAILTSCRKYITSQNFKGGKISTILGGGIIDLSGAKLAEGENVIELTSIMGGVSFRVPQNWKVIVNVHSIFGGFEDKRRYFTPLEPQSGSVLVIKGTVLMGGGTITF